MLDRKHGLLAEIAEAYIYDGRPLDAIKLLKRALRTPDWYRWNLGWAYYNAHDYDAALAELENIKSKPGDTEHVYDVQLMIAACYAQKGNDTMAKSNIGMFRKHRGSNFKVDTASKRTVFRSTRDQDHWFDGLRKAGLRDRQQTRQRVASRPNKKLLFPISRRGLLRHGCKLAIRTQDSYQPAVE